MREALEQCRSSRVQSIRQVHLWLRQEQVLLPSVETVEDGRRIVWKLPVYNTVRGLLTNPVYGGAYAFGRTASRVTVENGRKRISRGHRRDREEWDVLIVDHHEGYISWGEFERNQRLIADNANCRGLMVRGAVRRGDALLAGLLRCGHCGRRLHVSYSGTDGYCVRYNCRGAHINHGTRPCIAFGGLRVDAAVATEVLRLLDPLGVEAALEAIAMREGEQAETRRQAELALTQARYEADLARRSTTRAIQRTAWSPASSTALVRSTLGRPAPSRASREERTAPVGLASGRRKADGARGRSRYGLVASRRHRGDAQANHSAMLEEIVATLTEERIELMIHWRGGDHTRLAVPRNRTGQHRWSSDADVRDLIRALARQQVDGAIAAT